MMGQAFALLASLKANRKGVTALEYGVIAAVVVVAVAGAASALDFSEFFGKVMDAVNAKVPAAS